MSESQKFFQKHLKVAQKVTFLKFRGLHEPHLLNWIADQDEIFKNLSMEWELETSYLSKTSQFIQENPRIAHKVTHLRVIYNHSDWETSEKWKQLWQTGNKSLPSLQKIYLRVPPTHIHFNYECDLDFDINTFQPFPEFVKKITHLDLGNNRVGMLLLESLEQFSYLQEITLELNDNYLRYKDSIPESLIKKIRIGQVNACFLNSSSLAKTLKELPLRRLIINSSYRVDDNLTELSQFLLQLPLLQYVTLNGFKSENAQDCVKKLSHALPDIKILKGHVDSRGRRYNNTSLDRN